MAAGLGSQEAAWSSHDDEEIVSDGEQPVAAWAWQPAAGSEAAGALRQLNGLLPPAGQQQQQQGLDACQSRGANAFSRAGPSRAPLTSSRAGAFRRPMKTAAAAEADRAASERAATDAAQLAAALGEGQQGAEPAAGGLEQGVPQPAPAPRPPPRMPAAGASFLSRRVLPPSQARVQELRQQLERSAAAATTGDGMPASAAGTRQVQRQQAPQEGLPVPAGDQTGAAAGPTPAAFADRPSSAGHRAVGTAAPGAAAVAAAAAAAVAPATAAAAATFHRTSEGLNVVYLNRQQQPDSHAGGRGGGKAKADSVNSGWGNNFVRIDLKVRRLGGCPLWCGWKGLDLVLQGRRLTGGHVCAYWDLSLLPLCAQHVSVAFPSLPGYCRRAAAAPSTAPSMAASSGSVAVVAVAAAGGRVSLMQIFAVQRAADHLLALFVGRLVQPFADACNAGAMCCTTASKCASLASPPVQPRACARWATVPTSWRAGRAAASAASSAAAVATSPRTAQPRRRRARGRWPAAATARTTAASAAQQACHPRLVPPSRSSRRQAQARGWRQQAFLQQQQQRQGRRHPILRSSMPMCWLIPARQR